MTSSPLQLQLDSFHLSSHTVTFDPRPPRCSCEACEDDLSSCVRARCPERRSAVEPVNAPLSVTRWSCRSRRAEPRSDEGGSSSPGPPRGPRAHGGRSSACPGGTSGSPEPGARLPSVEASTSKTSKCLHGVDMSESTSGNQSLPDLSLAPCPNWSADPRVVGVGLFLCVFICVAIVGNVLVILSVLRDRHLHTVTNLFIVNLALADLLLSGAVLPFSASLEVLGCWRFGRVFCDVWAAVDVLCCTASILSLCVISIDRYIGVKHCLEYPSIVTERRAARVLGLVWLLSAGVSVGPLLGWKEPPPVDERVCSITEEPGYALFSSLLSFYLPLSVILVMYFRVYVVARRTTRSLEAGVKRERNESTEVVLRIHRRSARDAPGGSGTARRTGRRTGWRVPPRGALSVRLLKFSREKKAAKTLAIVVGMFVLCWLPFFFFLPMGR
ncbi:Alpha-1D adrenergic receptor [Liparis tanakae]|uniref:Alpha-1D adrenergic receptor n=1 Tax=Liparis tanakae TaxID=230148 RepID=A0A4Z2EQZ7_9TELE|nr:Alpha-1D adrenergic receptor [Liparis tanakae]